ncbi:MAG: HEPN domain-containing protein [Bacteroidales bacterium]|nr:HEPN domain-containing protein [Bacteroidales bacterium]
MSDEERKNVASCFCDKSDAYIESAIELSKIAGFQNVFPRGDVIGYLFHHSIELFLKGMLFYKNGDISKIHNLKSLLEQLEIGL